MSGTAAGPVALVTGASRGIGRETALAFGRHGFRVALNFLKEKTGAGSVAAEIERSGGKAALFPADVTDPLSVKTMVEAVVREYGRLDVLVNNAAVCRDRSILRMSRDEWETVTRTNLGGAFFVLQECARVMAKQRSGAIINIASIVGLRGSVGNANYASAKAGLIALTKAAARELGRHAVRVNAVLPGFHLTDMGATAPEAYREKIREESVLGTTTDIAELTRFIVFLSEMKTVSGQVFNWDSRIV